MARVRRIDFSTLKAPTRRADGTLVADALITRTGVFSYRNPDGTERREYRPPSQVFDDKTIASFRLVPVTDDHPPMMLNAGNAKQYSVGAVGESVRKDGDFVAATIAVHDAVTIAKMDAGKTQVSCGYDCELDETPGVSPDGQRYDAVQTNIVGNHLAIVTNARAGAAAAVRMDAAMMVGGAPQAGSADDPNGPSGGAVGADKIDDPDPDDDDDDDDDDDKDMDASAAEYDGKMVEYDWAEYDSDDDLTAEQRDKMPDSDFAAPGKKLPIHDAEHVRAAMSRFSKTDFSSSDEKRVAFHRILAKAKALGIDSAGFEKRWQGRLDRKDTKVMNLEKALAELAAAQKALGAATHRADAAEAKVKTLETERTKLEGERDGVKSGLVAAEKARKDAMDGVAPLVKARVALQTNAVGLFGAAAKFKRADGSEHALEMVTDREIMLAVVNHVDGANVDVDADGKQRDDVYVRARYDAAIERATKSTAMFAAVGAAITESRNDASAGMDELAKARAGSEKARAEMIAHNRNIGHTPVATGAAGEKGK